MPTLEFNIFNTYIQYSIFNDNNTNPTTSLSLSQCQRTPWVQYLPLCMKLRYCLLKIATFLLKPHCFASDGYQPWRTDCRFNCCWMILPTKSLIRASSQPCHKLPELLRIGKLPPHFFTVGTSSRQHSTKITVPLQPTYFCFPNKIDCGSHLVRYLVYSF